MAARIGSSSRPDVPSSQLAEVEPGDFDVLADHRWTELVTGGEASYAREWRNEQVDLLRIEIWEGGNPFAAEGIFRSYTLKPRYERQFGSDLVRSVDPPDTVADRVDMFCGNVGRSSTATLEKCQIWGYWARYGQYVVYLEVYGRFTTVDDFRSMVVVFDRHIASLLDSALAIHGLWRVSEVNRATSTQIH